MDIPAVRGIYYNGKIKPLEDIPYKKDIGVLIVFLKDTEIKDIAWDKAVAMDFLKGYSEKDTAYDRLCL